MGRTWLGSIDTSGSMYGSQAKSKEPYKEEDLICVDNSGRSEFVVSDNGTAEGLPRMRYSRLPLTVGKRYKKLYDSYNTIVINDYGEKAEYPREKFEKITVQDWRQSQLDKLLE